jgi:flagellar FliJ protein
VATAFRFRLEPVLRHRRRLEDGAALELAAKRRSVDRIGDRLAEINGEIERSRRALATAGRRGTTGLELRRLARHVECLKAEAVAVGALLAAERGLMEQARERLVAAAQDRRVLERLAETQRAEHARAMEAEERRRADDLTTSTYEWRRREAVDPARP